MKRIASIWFPHLAVERWAKDSDFSPDAPVASPSRARTDLSSMPSRSLPPIGREGRSAMTDARALTRRWLRCLLILRERR
jgi:hypothetical protein